MALRTLGDVVHRAGGAVSVHESVSVLDLARALRAHSVDAAAVLTASGELAGIATASDVARALARAEDPESTAVAQVMTVHPTMLPPSETPANALAIMRAGGFRHLPVVDPASGCVLGIVDVLHLAYDAIVRLHNTYSMVPTKRSFLFQRAARETIEKPTLRSFGDLSTYTALLPDHTALAACEALVRNKASAIVVVDANGVLEGIFTCRDVAARVVSNARDPRTTLLREVMTPRPDFALPDFTVLECLQRMQACGFRHLPIVAESTQRVEGLVDVLKLASDALSGLHRVTGGESEPASSSYSTNPTGSSSSSKAGTAKTTASLHPASSSSSAPPAAPSLPSALPQALPTEQPPSAGISSIFSSLFSSGIAGAPDTLPKPIPLDHARNATDRPLTRTASGAARSRSPSSSAGARQVSTLNAADLARIRMTSHYAPSGSSRGHPTHAVAAGTASSSTADIAGGAGRGGASSGGGASGRLDAAAEPPATLHQNITFKFKDCNREYRRLKLPRVAARGAFDQLIVDVRHRYFTTAGGDGLPSAASIRIKYIDEDGDEVVITNDEDLAACFEEAAELGLKTVKLKVTEVQSRRSLTSFMQSPLSSLPNSPPMGMAEPPLAPPIDVPSMRASIPQSLAEERRHPAPSGKDVGRGSDGGDGTRTGGAKPAGSPPSNSITSPTVRSDPTSPSTVRAAEAHALMMDQHVAAAIRKYDEAVKINGANARALAGRGAANLISGNTSSAEEDYRASLRLLEEKAALEGGGVSSGSSGSGGSGGSNNGNSDDNERTFDMVVVGLTETLIEQRRYEEAAEMAAKLDGKPSKVGCADALRDELESSSTAAVEALGSRQFGDAMAMFTNAIRVETAFVSVADGKEARSAALRSGRGRCYLEMNDYEMAVEDFEAAVELEPDNLAGLKGCGKCLVELDQMSRALEMFERAGKVDAGDEQVQEQIGTLRKLLPAHAEEGKDSIAKLGAMIGGLNLPKSQSTLGDRASPPLAKPADAARASTSLDANSAAERKASKKKKRAARRSTRAS